MLNILFGSDLQGITSIGNSAFNNCKNLKGLLYP